MHEAGAGTARIRIRFMISAIILTFIAVIWFAFSIFLSHQNGSDTYRTSIGIAEKIYTLLEKLGAFEEGALFSGYASDGLEFVNQLLRRCAHVVIFLVMAILICMSLYFLAAYTRIRIPVWAGFVFCVVWSWIDEATKIAVQGRHFAWLDVGLNIAGCAAGAAVFILWRRLREKHIREKTAGEKTES